MMPNQQPPIFVPAASPATDPKHAAALIFLHGFGDEADTFEGTSSRGLFTIKILSSKPP